MKKNMGTFDRIARTGLALVFIVLLATEMVTGLVAWILGVLTVVVLLTSAVSFCPLYAPLNISTRNDEMNKH
jgi:hypothetical protein